MSTNTLWKKHNYLNRNIDILIGKEIIEYDMKEAGFNIIIKFKMLPQETIDMLYKHTKEQRKILIGKIAKADKEFAKQHVLMFGEMRKLFFEANGLVDDDILSIKKDAIFVYKYCHNTVIDNVEFIEKNVYSSYLYMNKNEFYYNKDTIHVKGINDRFLIDHEDYMLSFISTIFNLIENQSHKKMIDFMKDFIELYKRKELPIEFYRELNKDSKYRFIEDNDILLSDVSNINLIDIRYNFINYIVPLLNIFI